LSVRHGFPTPALHPAFRGMTQRMSAAKLPSFSHLSRDSAHSRMAQELGV
jgi:hypothetical protein